MKRMNGVACFEEALSLDDARGPRMPLDGLTDVRVACARFWERRGGEDPEDVKSRMWLAFGKTARAKKRAAKQGGVKA